MIFCLTLFLSFFLSRCFSPIYIMFFVLFIISLRYLLVLSIFLSFFLSFWTFVGLFSILKTYSFIVCLFPSFMIRLVLSFRFTFIIFTFRLEQWSVFSRLVSDGAKHVKFTEECFIYTENHVLVRMIFTKRAKYWSATSKRQSME